MTELQDGGGTSVWEAAKGSHKHLSCALRNGNEMRNADEERRERGHLEAKELTWETTVLLLLCPTLYEVWGVRCSSSLSSANANEMVRRADPESVPKSLVDEKPPANRQGKE